MKQSEAWVRQAQSDLDAAVFLHQQASKNASMYCHAIAKYQQTVEKSVKAMVSAIVDLGIQFTTITASHLPSKEVDALLKIKQIDNKSLGSIARILTNKIRKQIHDLCVLAPKFPEKGQPFPRNTEYPFEQGGTWTAPAASGVFTIEEVQDAKELAWVLHRQAARFVSAVRRGRIP